MPTFIDKDDVVHDVDVSSGAIFFHCEITTPTTALGRAFPLPRQGRTYSHEAKPVTCFVCLALSPLPPVLKEFMVCDHCGSWWAEQNEKLVGVSREFVDSLPEYRVLQAGSLPVCPRCR